MYKTTTKHYNRMVNNQNKDKKSNMQYKDKDREIKYADPVVIRKR